MAQSHPRYRFGPLERRGLIAGWRGGQIASVVAGLVVAIAMLHGRPSVEEILAAVAAVAAGVAFAWWPVAGRSGEEWLPVVVRWCASGGATRRRWRSGVPLAGHCIGPDRAPCLVAKGEQGRLTKTGDRAPARAGAPQTARAPAGRRGGVFCGLDVLGARLPEGAGALGVVRDARAGTYTAALSVIGHNFALLGPDEKERRVASWASVLTSLARDHSVLHRLQWIASTVPDGGAAVVEHLDTNGVLPAGAVARRSYMTLLVSAGAATCRHEVLLAVQVRAAGAAGRAMRALGGGDAGACAVLGRELGSLQRQLGGADIQVDRALDARALAGVVRRAIAGADAGRACPPCGVGWPWPLSSEVEWGCLRTDEAWHATYWIAEWPRVDVGPEFLGPLLLGSTRRSVAVVMEPIAPSRAVRQAERARTADIADAELRRRGGFLSTARRAREAELASRRETELADGHASFRFSGYVTVTALDKAELTAACDATEQAASQCRLELRRLYGDQERAFTCTLPLGRGLA